MSSTLFLKGGTLSALALALAATLPAVEAGAQDRFDRQAERIVREVRQAERRAEPQARPVAAQRPPRGESRAARIERRAERRAEQIDRRSSIRAEQVERRGDVRARQLELAGRERAARQVDQRSERNAAVIDRRGERRADRVERHADRGAVQIRQRRDRRDDRRDWRDGRDWRHDRDRWGHDYRDVRRWDRGWRGNRQYNWFDHRRGNRFVFRPGPYFAPYRSHRYSRLDIGFFLDGLYFQPRFYIDDPWRYRLPPVYGPYRWVRYYDDVLLVDVYTGEVVDVIHDFFW